MTDIGHNSAAASRSGCEALPQAEPVGDRNVAASDPRLLLLVERIERLEEEKKGLADDIKDVYAEGKAVGYDTKMMRQLRKLRAMDPATRREQEMLLETYKAAVGLG